MYSRDKQILVMILGAACVAAILLSSSRDKAPEYGPAPGASTGKPTDVLPEGPFIEPFETPDLVIQKAPFPRAEAYEPMDREEDTDPVLDLDTDESRLPARISTVEDIGPFLDVDDESYDPSENDSIFEEIRPFLDVDDESPDLTENNSVVEDIGRFLDVADTPYESMPLGDAEPADMGELLDVGDEYGMPEYDIDSQPVDISESSDANYP